MTSRNSIFSEQSWKRRESNLGEKRERFLCAMLTPRTIQTLLQRSCPIFLVQTLVHHAKGSAQASSMPFFFQWKFNCHQTDYNWKKLEATMDKQNPPPSLFLEQLCKPLSHYSQTCLDSNNCNGYRSWSSSLCRTISEAVARLLWWTYKFYEVKVWWLERRM